MTTMTLVSKNWNMHRTTDHIEPDQPQKENVLGNKKNTRSTKRNKSCAFNNIQGRPAVARLVYFLRFSKVSFPVLKLSPLIQSSIDHVSK